MLGALLLGSEGSRIKGFAVIAQPNGLVELLRSRHKIM